MPTLNPRVNITFDPETVDILVYFAEKQHKSISGLTKELVLEALERREDMDLSAIAKIRDVPNAKKMTHKNAWK